jgi:hypothetical protein
MSEIAIDQLDTVTGGAAPVAAGGNALRGGLLDFFPVGGARSPVHGGSAGHSRVLSTPWGTFQMPRR